MATTITLPDSLDYIAEEMRTQDNCCTAYPIFLVRQRRRIYGMDPAFGSGDNFVWQQEGETVDPADWDGDEDRMEDEGCEKLYYVDTWENVTGCFTRKAAQAYITRNGHNLSEPQIYVDTLYRNAEMDAIRVALGGRP